MMAIPIVRGYRTISYGAASILAPSQPFDILTDVDIMVYDRIDSVGRRDSATS